MPGIFTVEQRGIGKPDYTKEISLGRERPGISLKYSQSLKNFIIVLSSIASPYSWVSGVLAPAASAHLVDADTGLAMPYTVPQGYTLAGISLTYSLSEDTIIRAYVDEVLGVPALFGIVGGPGSGNVIYMAEVIGIGSHIVDPTGESSHIFDIIATNQGAGNSEGTVGGFFVLEAVGTAPLPTTKTVKCKWCGHEWVVPNETKAINCPSCGELNIYLDLSRFRETR